MSGESYIFEAEHYEAQPDDLVFARQWFGIAEQLWVEGKWTPHPQKFGSGGLNGVIDGLQEGRDGKISGVKLVYRVDDTEWP